MSEKKDLNPAKLQLEAFEIESLNLESLDVEELERRLELAAGVPLDLGWLCSCDNRCDCYGTYCTCDGYTCDHTCTGLCTAYCDDCTTLYCPENIIIY